MVAIQISLFTDECNIYIASNSEERSKHGNTFKFTPHIATDSSRKPRKYTVDVKIKQHRKHTYPSVQINWIQTVCISDTIKKIQKAASNAGIDTALISFLSERRFVYELNSQNGKWKRTSLRS